MFTLGIDPGTKGAIALCSDVHTIQVWDVPYFLVGKTKRRINELAFLDLMAGLTATYDPSLAVIEDVSGWGAQAGQFVFGYTTGSLTTAVIAAGVPIIKVRPETWKRALGLPVGKSEAKEVALQYASQLMPSQRHLWPLKKHHDRAEAALLALYGHRHLDRSYHRDDQELCQGARTAMSS